MRMIEQRVWWRPATTSDVPARIIAVLALALALFAVIEQLR